MVDRFVRYAERTARAGRRSRLVLHAERAQRAGHVEGAATQALGDRAELRADAARAVGSDRFHMYFLGDSYKVRDVCLAAHAKGRDAIKAAVPGAKVGLTLALQELSAGPGGEALY